MDPDIALCHSLGPVLPWPQEVAQVTQINKAPAAAWSLDSRMTSDGSQDTTQPDYFWW